VLTVDLVSHKTLVLLNVILPVAEYFVGVTVTVVSDSGNHNVNFFPVKTRNTVRYFNTFYCGPRG
jgi:hypothetical protein